MGCQNTYIIGYVGTGNTALIGVIGEPSGGELQITYFNATTKAEYTGDLFPCCGGSVSYSGCVAYITGFFGSSNEPLLATVNGMSGGNLNVTYWDIQGNVSYTGNVYSCCEGSEFNMYGETVTGVAGVDVTMTQEGTAFALGWDNIMHTSGWTQAGQVITMTDGSVLAGGETIKIFYTKP